MAIEIVVLAGGKGNRMRSNMPKVLHRLADKALIDHVLDQVSPMGPVHVVVGYLAEQVQQHLAGREVQFAFQAQQKGTGHALAQVMDSIGDDKQILVVFGDVPLIRRETLVKLMEVAGDNVGLLTLHAHDPAGYGRIIRDTNGAVKAIVEHKDATPEQQAIHEINTGIMSLPAAKVRQWLGQLHNNNVQGEYYLTDVVALAVADGLHVRALSVRNEQEVAGINDRLQLAELERSYMRLKADDLMRSGVSLRDPSRIDIRAEVENGFDCEIDVNVVLSGRIKLGNNVRIGAGCILEDVELADGVVIYPYSLLSKVRVEQDAEIGPFARLRPGTLVGDSARVGNFVELKNTHLGAGAKVNHLSYLGDASVGEYSNIGAGTISCNYDGLDKHRTVIGERAFVGSNCTLVAPIEIGDGAYLGAGSVLTRTAPAGQLTLARTRQKTLVGWLPPKDRKPSDPA